MRLYAFISFTDLFNETKKIGTKKMEFVNRQVLNAVFIVRLSCHLKMFTFIGVTKHSNQKHVSKVPTSKIT